MQNTKPNIAIVGSGKLTTALFKNLFSSANITVIKRENSPSDGSFFVNHSHVSSNMEDVASAKHIILAVTPDASGDILRRLDQVRFNNDPSQEIISFVSGLPRSTMKRFLNGFDGSIIRGTCNTNVSLGQGLICATEYSPLFSSMGKYIKEKPNWILRSIVTVGSGNAIDCQSLELNYKYSSYSKSLYSWLLDLRGMLDKYDFKMNNVPREYSPIIHYLHNKMRIFSNQEFRYNRTSASVRSVATIKSTIDTLLQLGTTVTVKDIQDLTKTVVTQNGCTEAGMSCVSSIEKLLSFECLQKGFKLIWERAKTFQKDVIKSIN